MKKKFKSKFFCVAVEGATTDGRQIERSWIEDMAATYNPTVYSARIWIEHMRSMLPDSPFRAYGDVTALKAEEITVAGEKKLALFAQIEPTNDLVNIVNKLKQKLFTSIEVSPKFADSGKAYLMGLAVTDSPASIGTSMLAFAAQNPEANPLADRKLAKDNLFSAAAETTVELEEQMEVPSPGAALLSRIKKLLGTEPEPKPDPRDDAQFGAMGEIVTELAQSHADHAEQFAALQAQHASAAAGIARLTEEFNALRTELSRQPDPSQPQRPPVAGGNAAVLTDC